MSCKIPQDFIDDLIARADIVDIIDSRIPLKKSGGNYVARCPFHNEKTPSFTVSREKQIYHCFGCGASGSVIGFLMDYDHLSFPEAIEELAQMHGLQVPKGNIKQGQKAPRLESIYLLQHQVAHYYAMQLRRHEQAQRAVNYLKTRGVSGAVARDYAIGYAPPGWNNLLKQYDRKTLLDAGLIIEKESGQAYDRFRDRIMFPIRDRRGRVIGFGGRVLDDSLPKYLNSPETPLFHKGKEVYGLYELLKSAPKPKHILIVEGYLDVIALAQHGISYAVATLGTATTKEHLERLFRYSAELVFCFDGDKAGLQAAWRALETALPVLREGRQVRFLSLPQGHDPDSLVRQEGAESFKQLAQEAMLFSDYFFRQLTENLDLNKIEGRAELVNRAKPLIGKIPPGVFRHMMEAQLAELTQFTTVELFAKPSTLKRGGALKLSAGERAKPSAMKVVLALLLQNPQLAQIAERDFAAGSTLSLTGGELLKKILLILKDKQDLSTGSIWERFRGLPEENEIRRLMDWDMLIPAEGVENEFRDALKRLAAQAKKERLEILLTKAKANGLNEQEREEMRQLLSITR